MKAVVDFSIFSSPIKAFGRVYGQMAVPDDIKIGDSIELIEGEAIELKSVTKLSMDEAIFGFSDLVFQSLEEAKNAALRLEAERGLFVDPYD